jgi:membrane fusion protein (multidrug efflux system)
MIPFVSHRAAQVLAVLLIGAAAAGCHGGGDDEGDAAPAAVVSAKTVVVTPQAFTEYVSAIGTVAPRAGHVATLSAPAPARVASVLVTSGQPVSRGQALVVLDRSTFEATLNSAQATVAAAARNAERSERLADEGIVPRKDAEAAAADLARARADLATAQRDAALATLRAPIGGVVTRMNATIGAAADPSQVLVEIADPSALDILLTVTPSDAGRVRPGAKVNLSAGQGASGESLGIGTVADVGGTVDSASRGVTVRVQAPTTRRPLRIGETIYGQIAVSTKANAIVVPVEALVPEGQAVHVYVVDRNDIAHAREVTVGGRTDRAAEITAGLAPGERIVTYGAYGMQDSARVAALRAGATPDSTHP